MKTCPVCSESYLECIEYCFRDGALLVLPGSEPEFEETEALPQNVVSRMKTDAQRSNKSPDEVTEPFEFSTPQVVGLSSSSEFLASSDPDIDEDLAGPQVLSNTQMFRKEDLLAMFDDDSTYNGEMISEDTYEEEPDTEEYEATETFSINKPLEPLEDTPTMTPMDPPPVAIPNVAAPVQPVITSNVPPSPSVSPQLAQPQQLQAPQMAPQVSINDRIYKVF